MERDDSHANPAERIRVKHGTVGALAVGAFPAFSSCATEINSETPACRILYSAYTALCIGRQRLGLRHPSVIRPQIPRRAGGDLRKGVPDYGALRNVRQ